MAFIAEDDGSLLQHAAPLDVDGVIAVDENVVDGRIVEKRLERAEAEDLIQDFLGDLVAVLCAEWNVLLTDKLVDGREEALATAVYVRLDGCEPCEIDAAQQFAMDGRLERVAGGLVECTEETGLAARLRPLCRWGFERHVDRGVWHVGCRSGFGWGQRQKASIRFSVLPAFLACVGMLSVSPQMLFAQVAMTVLKGELTVGEIGSPLLTACRSSMKLFGTE